MLFYTCIALGMTKAGVEYEFMDMRNRVWHRGRDIKLRVGKLDWEVAESDYQDLIGGLISEAMAELSQMGIPKQWERP